MTHSKKSRSDTRYIKADNPKAIDVLKEIQATLLDETNNDPVVESVTKIMIQMFKLRTTKP